MATLKDKVTAMQTEKKGLDTAIISIRASIAEHRKQIENLTNEMSVKQSRYDALDSILTELNDTEEMKLK